MKAIDVIINAFIQGCFSFENKMKMELVYLQCFTKIQLFLQVSSQVFYAGYTLYKNIKILLHNV